MTKAGRFRFYSCPTLRDQVYCPNAQTPYDSEILNINRHIFLQILALAAVPCSALAWQPGTMPPPPARMVSSGFSVNTSSRNDVVAFWHAVYMASEGYENRVGWTGNYTGNSGRTSKEFIDDVERRVNFFRAMCGVPSNVRMNSNSTVLIESTDEHKPLYSTLKSNAAQAAALMLIRNYNPATGKDPAIDHNPPSSLIGWSEAAWNANANGNLAFGLYGPGAMTEYVVEEVASGSATSYWNTLVGHRRWILFPKATDFATGDQPGTSVTRPPTNVLYISQKPGELGTDPTPGFVPYPPAGFVPAAMNSRFWSLSHAGADFSSANVKITDQNGRPVPVASVQSNASYGDPALLWRVSGIAAARSVDQDTTFNVSVTGIAGAGVPSSFSYVVTLINPDRLTSDLSLTGTAYPPSNKTTAYTFTPPPFADALQVTAFQRKSSPWKEDAENARKTRVIDRTASNYPLISRTGSFAGFTGIAGKASFRLTFPTTYDTILRAVPEQSFELDRLLLPKSKATLRFNFRRGFMTTGSSLAVETSADGGVTWKATGAVINGVSNSYFDNGFSKMSVKLPASGQSLRVRFRYFCKPGVPIYTHEAAPKSPTGIFIDDITAKNCDWLEPVKTSNLGKTAAAFSFNASTAGGPLKSGSQWCLAMRSSLGAKWFPYGPLKNVVVKAP